ncbi:hypothetical protein T01_6352 [Trichinella spiralis]|uniref:Uncharacterized protein n=1 Tax=Trichinella spiralis TaxID=6334 RepID=A0A0V1BEE2_TRISP|nr:hypothetical protein T01_6352 [Trichinella spiralis]
MRITFEIVNANGKDAMLAPNRKTVKASSFHKAVEMTSLKILSICTKNVNNPLPSVGIKKG